jgi:hypothetical protein
VKFVLLIYRSAPPELGLPPEDDRAALARHRELQKDSKARDELVAVARLDDARTARTVRKQGAAHSATDGPFPETKEWLVGFYLLDCESFEEAEQRAAKIADDHHVVEVRPATWTRSA